MTVKSTPVFPYKASPYQEDIFDFVQHGQGNAIISARAGCGKTSVLTHVARLVCESHTCIFLAFNTSIAKEVKEKLEDVPNLKVRTVHSVGYDMLRRNLEVSEIEIDIYKYRRILMGCLSETYGTNLDSRRQATYIHSILSLIDFARFNQAQIASEIARLAVKYGVTVDSDECEVVECCLNKGKSDISVVDYTDMIWLPVELDCASMGLRYDWVLHDECQDASPIMRLFIQKCFKGSRTRYLAAGDPYQSIYAFAGADEESFHKLCKRPNTKIFQLPISYRCPKSVVTLANTIVPDIVACDSAKEGSVLEDCSINAIKDGDMVLSRNKSSLAVLHGKLLAKDIRSYIKGTEIGDNLVEILNDVDGDELCASLERDGVFARLYEALFKERDRLMEVRDLDWYDATLSAQIIERYDQLVALYHLASRYFYKTDLIRHIGEVFRNDSEGVCLSTIHKAKGLECDNVYIVCRSTMPSKLAKKVWELKQEENLIYVAYTRAKKVLGFISEKEVPPSGSSVGGDSILSDLQRKQIQVEKLLGVTFNQREDRRSVAKAKKESEKKAESGGFLSFEDLMTLLGD
ncbi:MAG: ATP-dependent helicase [Bacteroidales bacterium]|nr:ATP-dependent helicase [Bacteroidales bacterium]